MVARRMLTIVDAAEYLGTSPRHVRRLVTDHSLSYYKIGGRNRFVDVGLDVWLDRRKVEGRAGRSYEASVGKRRVRYSSWLTTGPGRIRSRIPIVVAADDEGERRSNLVITGDE